MDSVTETLRRASSLGLPTLLEDIGALSRLESPSDDAVAVDRLSSEVARRVGALGGVEVWHSGGIFGRILEARFFGQKSRKPIILLGHLDTVWSLGTLERMPVRVGDGRMWGPGVLDMKAGVAMALMAVKLLSENRLGRPVTLLLNSDEEVGSVVSRKVTEAVASEAEAVFVLEPAQALSYKTSRKGVGCYVIEITGVGAHAGVDFEKGHSAIREAAHLVQTVSNFTDPSKKRTVNCGVLHGGSRSNVVAEHARVEVDVRVATVEDGRVVDGLFRTLRCTNPGCRLKVSGGINRPPMERTRETVALFERARGLAAELGFALDEAATGGGSDGNFTSAIGIPTLDGMGAVGDGAHAAHESVLIEHLAPRTALLAAMIATT